MHQVGFHYMNVLFFPSFFVIFCSTSTHLIFSTPLQHHINARTFVHKFYECALISNYQKNVTFICVCDHTEVCSKLLALKTVLRSNKMTFCYCLAGCVSVAANFCTMHFTSHRYSDALIGRNETARKMDFKVALN